MSRPRATYSDARRENSHFQMGSGCYQCRMCGKRTRGKGSAGTDGASVGLCDACYEVCVAENAEADGHPQ